MGPRVNESEICKGGCGKAVNNASGVCRKCRMLVCKRCQKRFSANAPGAVFCGTCKSYRTTRLSEMGEG